MFTCTFGPGMSMGMPDICMTPPLGLPVPYPNFGMNAMAVPTYFTVCTMAMPELTMTAMYPTTIGDNLGVMGGVASGMFMGPGRCMLGSQVAFVAGQPTWRLMAITLHNLTNAPGATMVPSQTVKQVLR